MRRGLLLCRAPGRRRGRNAVSILGRSGRHTRSFPWCAVQSGRGPRSAWPRDRGCLVADVASYIASANGRNRSTYRSGWMRLYARWSAYGGLVKNRSTVPMPRRGIISTASLCMTPAWSRSASYWSSGSARVAEGCVDTRRR